MNLFNCKWFEFFKYFPITPWHQSRNIFLQYTYIYILHFIWSIIWGDEIWLQKRHVKNVCDIDIIIITYYHHHHHLLFDGNDIRRWGNHITSIWHKIWEDMLLSALTWFPFHNIQSLDGVVLTHFHFDALGGLDDLRLS